MMVALFAMLIACVIGALAATAVAGVVLGSVMFWRWMRENRWF